MLECLICFYFLRKVNFVFNFLFLLFEFINCDKILSLGYSNTFAYCIGNPVTHIDFTGLSPTLIVGSKYIPTSHSIWIQMDPAGREQASDINDLRTGARIEENKRKPFDKKIERIESAYDSFWANYHGYHKMAAEVNYNANSKIVQDIYAFIMEAKDNEYVNIAISGYKFISGTIKVCANLISAGAISATFSPISYPVAMCYIMEASYNFTNAQKHGTDFFNGIFDLFR